MTAWVAMSWTIISTNCSLKRFVAEVMPTASELGIRMCVHPDDPPRPLFGLPRIFSKQEDFEYLTALHDDLANGITLCAGSLGASPHNNVPEIAEKFAKRIHFAHLRNVQIEEDGSFQESEHLDGAVRMPLLVWVLLQEEKNRQADDRADFNIPFRPDHGHELLSDAEMETHPGYPLVGRLRGLAEIRGVIDGLNYASGERSQFGA
ncbi:mannonate dehydratase [Maritalea porphyrae]|uniref:mannonate dehydratase n=1 Tax=Maritalea porphyrae TaxID=880732 RepID=UPI0024E16D8E|nr:mannonate dehydratase [Maritalea porphyrae]